MVLDFDKTEIGMRKTMEQLNMFIGEITRMTEQINKSITTRENIKKVLAQKIIELTNDIKIVQKHNDDEPDKNVRMNKINNLEKEIQSMKRMSDELNKINKMAQIDVKTCDAKINEIITSKNKCEEELNKKTKISS